MEKIRESISQFGYADNKTEFTLRDLLVKLYGNVTFNCGPNPSDIIIRADLDREDNYEEYPIIIVEKLREPSVEEQIRHGLGKLSKERLLELLLKLKEENGEQIQI